MTTAGAATSTLNAASPPRRRAGEAGAAGTPSERPILFSGAMVRAILAGAKTQTRRLYKPRYPGPYEVIEDGIPYQCDEAGDYWRRLDPYGVAGERLWVREKWAPHERAERRIHFAADWCSWLKVIGEDGPCWDFRERIGVDCPPPPRWKPGIHMRRWASRIDLEVTGVRVERLQDISEEDARAEGIIEWTSHTGAKHYGLTVADVWERTARDAFARLWDSINGERASWESNPRVWRVAFRRLP